jgi:serine/threonine protein phosphatase PrpC
VTTCACGRGSVTRLLSDRGAPLCETCATDAIMARAGSAILWASLAAARRPLANQDRAGAECRDHLARAAVCDGVGGLQRGAEAAEVALCSILRTLSEHRNGALLPQGEDPARVAVLVSLIRAHDEVRRSVPEGAACAACALVVPGAAWVGWVGDCRAYALAGGRPALLLTEDDSVRAAVERETGRPAPRASRALLQALGFGERDVKPHTVQVPTWCEVLLLTTDGAHEPAAALLATPVARGATPTGIVAAVLGEARRGGLPDDATALTIDLRLT